MPLRTVVRMFLVVVPAAALAAMVWVDLAPRGVWQVVSDPTRYQPNISFFYPEGRLWPAVWGRGGWQQQVVSEPLYLDVRMPRRLAQVRIRLWYQTVGDTGLRVGMRVGAGGIWQYRLQQLASAGEDNGWQVGEAVFDLAEATVERQRIRFILSAPRLNHQSALVIHRFAAVASGDPLTLLGMGRKFFHRITRQGLAL